jgi:hypothetical protein
MLPILVEDIVDRLAESESTLLAVRVENEEIADPSEELYI